MRSWWWSNGKKRVQLSSIICWPEFGLSLGHQLITSLFVLSDYHRSSSWGRKLIEQINVVQQLPWQCLPGEDVGLVEEEEVDWDLLSFLQPAEWWGLLDTGVLTPALGDWSWAGVTLGGSLGLAGAGDLGTDWGTLLTLLLWEAACLAHRFGSDCLEVLSVWNNNFSDWLQNWRTKKPFSCPKYDFLIFCCVDDDDDDDCGLSASHQSSWWSVVESVWVTAWLWLNV